MREIRDVFLPDLNRLGIVIQIELAARQPHSALVELRDHMRGVMKIWRGAEAKHGCTSFRIGRLPRARNRGVNESDDVSNLALAANRIDTGQLRTQPRKRVRISRRLICTRRPVIADLLFHWRSLRWRFRGRVEDGLVHSRSVP